MKLYPLLMKPFFRSGQDTPWGGDLLRDALLKDAPGTAGESLEVCADPGCESVVANGECAGRTLSEMAALWGEGLTGAARSFPLRLALLDAAEDSPSRAGGSEGWIILNAENGAEIHCGADLILPRPGDVYYIPRGTVRSLGAGVLACSLQGTGAPEDAPAGNLQRPEGATVLCRGGSRTYYICDGSIELSRLNVSGSMPLPAGRMLLLTPIAPCSLLWADGEIEIAPCSTVILPAGLDGARIEGTLKVFAAAVPDQAALRQELGYRAELVPGLTEAAR